MDDSRAVVAFLREVEAVAPPEVSVRAAATRRVAAWGRRHNMPMLGLGFTDPD